MVGGLGVQGGGVLEKTLVDVEIVTRVDVFDGVAEDWVMRLPGLKRVIRRRQFLPNSIIISYPPNPLFPLIRNMPRQQIMRQKLLIVKEMQIRDPEIGQNRLLLQHVHVVLF